MLTQKQNDLNIIKEPSIVEDFMYGSNVAQSDVSIRLGFLRKVYGILSAQLAFSTIIGTLIMCFLDLHEILVNNSWFLIVNLFSTVLVLIILMAKRAEYPVNYYLLGAFTFLESITVGLIASFYSSWTVIQAFCLTTLIVIILTVYTFQTKRDFKISSALLSTFLLLVFIGSLFQVFFPSKFLQTTMAILGAFLFSAFIVYDTKMIMKQLSPEEYIIGVINLYLDIINIFLELLKILDSIRQQN